MLGKMSYTESVFNQAQEMANMINRVKFSTKVSFMQVEEVMPSGYTIVPPGSACKPGSIGEGFDGEPLVILLPGDDGKWFDDLVDSIH